MNNDMTNFLMELSNLMDEHDVSISVTDADVPDPLGSYSNILNVKGIVFTQTSLQEDLEVKFNTPFLCSNDIDERIGFKEGWYGRI